MAGLGGYTSLSFGGRVGVICSTELNLWFKHFEHEHEVLCLPSISCLPSLRAKGLSLVIP